MKSIKIKKLIPFSEYNLDTPFIMVLMKENKSEKLDLQGVGKDITSMPIDEFLNYLNCAKKDAI